MVGVAMGISGAEALKEALDLTMQDGQSRVLGKTVQNGEKKILFIGEQVQGNAFRAAYQKKHGGASVRVGCIFGRKAELAQPQDIELADEQAIVQLLRKEAYDCVVADPLFAELIPVEKRESIRFAAFPHIAVSSKLHWDAVPVFLSEKMEKMLDC